MKKILSFILACLPIIFLLVGCSEMETYLSPSSRRVTVTAQMPEADTRADLAQEENTLNLIAKWQSDDEVKVILLQGDQKYEVGKVPIANISSDGKRASFSYDIPSGLDITKSYKLYAFCGIEGFVDKKEDGSWSAYCTARLLRTEMSKLKAPLASCTEVSMNTPVAQFQHFQTYEVLHIKNVSTQSITFQHEGFDVADPWYRGVPNMYDFNTWSPGTLPQVWHNEATSEAIAVPAAGTACIISTYLPSGYQMKDAELKAKIDGVDVKSSNKKSSEIDVETGHAYHMYATWDGTSLAFDDIDSPVNPTDHEYVDLDLPSGTLWATCNMGANSPEDCGDFYAWGETEPKSSFTWDNYKFYGGLNDDYYSYRVTKYCTNGRFGPFDNKTELDPEDDAAYVNWGSDWRIPSIDEFKELKTNCIWTTTTKNGKSVYEVKSKKGENTIFLPIRSGFDTFFWSRSLYSDVPYEALTFRYNNYYFYYSDSFRSAGCYIRPVIVPPVINVSEIILSNSSLNLKMGGTAQLTATVEPSNANNKFVSWKSSDANIASVDWTGKVMGITVGSCTITCEATDGSGIYTECQVTVINEHEWVDLDLPSGTLWATCNVGANRPEEYGDYFAWGETEPKDNYDWSPYRFYDDTNSTFNKYCMNERYGIVDDKTELEPEDDAATANWGSGWQMPSLSQLMELYSSKYTTAQWSGNGCLITSMSNGNSVFLPAAGYREETNLVNAGSYGYLWTRTLYPDNSCYAYRLYFYKYGKTTVEFSSRYYYYRAGGCSVRPVRKQ